MAVEAAWLGSEELDGMVAKALMVVAGAEPKALRIGALARCSVGAIEAISDEQEGVCVSVCCVRQFHLR